MPERTAQLYPLLLLLLQGHGAPQQIAQPRLLVGRQLLSQLSVQRHQPITGQLTVKACPLEHAQCVQPAIGTSVLLGGKKKEKNRAVVHTIGDDVINSDRYRP